MKEINIKTIDSIEDEKIEWFLKQQNKKLGRSILAGLLIILSLIFGLIGIIFAFIIYFGLFAAIKISLNHRKFMRQFAKSKGFLFSKTLSTFTFTGRLFKIGHSRRANNAIFGEYNKFPINIFNYNYTVGHGKHSHTYRFTVCEIEIPKTEFPYILLKSDSMFRYTSHDLFGINKDIRIKLDAEFEKSFNLYCTQDYEIEVLQIFTKQLLALIRENGDHFSIEFAGNNIYIYDDMVIRKKEDLEKLWNVMKKILDNSGALLSRLHDDFESMHEVYRK